MTILHVITLLSMRLSPASGNTTTAATWGPVTILCPRKIVTQLSRRARGRVGDMISRLSKLYSIADSKITSIETPRAPTRVIGQRQLAGLNI